MYIQIQDIDLLLESNVLLETLLVKISWSDSLLHRHKQSYVSETRPAPRPHTRPVQDVSVRLISRAGHIPSILIPLNCSSRNRDVHVPALADCLEISHE